MSLDKFPDLRDVEKEISFLKADIYFFENKKINIDVLKVIEMQDSLVDKLKVYENNKGPFIFNSRGCVEERVKDNEKIDSLQWRLLGYVKNEFESMTVSVCDKEKLFLVRKYEDTFLVNCFTEISFQAQLHFFKTYFV